MVARGHFVLHANVLPKVIAGRYRFVSKVDGLPFTARTETTHVHVSAPRFTMPTDQILSSFPPANAEGAFGDRLPQIVLKRRTLPWERNPQGGSSADGSHPWLALVVVAEGEAELSPVTAVEQCTTAAGLNLSDRDVDKGYYLAVTESVVRKIFPCEEDLPLLVHVREVDVQDTELAAGDDDGWLSVVLANRLPVFDQATGTPVRYLACLVNLEGQIHELPTPTPPGPTFEWKRAEDWRLVPQGPISADHVVSGTGWATSPTSSAFGAPGPAAAPGAAAAAAATGQGPTGVRIGAALDGATATHGPAAAAAAGAATGWAAKPLTTAATERINAVSLDPDAQLLVRDEMRAGWHVPISLIAAERVLKFPVLAFWSFTTTGGDTFETLMQGLDHGLLGTRHGDHINPPVDAREEPPHPDRPEVVETGHIHLDARSRRGDRNQAWYRGPLVPHPTLREEPVAGRLPVAHAADQLRRVVPEGGEDLGYAAAFEIGRLLALSQLSVVAALQRYRNEQFGAERVKHIVDAFVPFEDLLAHAGHDLVRVVNQTLMERLATNPGATIGPPRPPADPGRPVDKVGGLDSLLATGFGLDLATLRKQAQSVGVAAALSATEAPLSSPDVGSPWERQDLEALQGVLESRLESAVSIALAGARQLPRDDPAPRPRRSGRPLTSATTPAPEPDVLDRLIAQAPADGLEEA